jgi:hypothetical protein
MEFIVKTMHVYGKNCLGCQYHKKDVMLSFSTPEGLRIHDIFLTNAQAQQLIIQLRKTLRNNEQDGN